MKDLKIALLGFGNAGRAFAKMLTAKQDEIRAAYGCGVQVTAIATASKGIIVNDDGIDLKKAWTDVEEKGAFSPETLGVCNLSPMEMIEVSDSDVICELTPLNIFTGEPAISHIRKAFECGKHVVSANKGPIAWAFDELAEIAASKGLCFFFETTVMDGTPVFNLMEHTLKFCRVTEVSGILNSTTNYMLEEMAAGKSYDEIIASGRRLGFIEADPAMDIEGYDAAAKVTALLNVLMKAGITPDDVDRTGIEHITEQDIREAAAQDCVIRLLCSGKRENDGSIQAVVKPVLVSRGDMLAAVDSTTSLVSITTDLMGKLSIVEHAPEIEQTAYGIFGDVIRVLETEVRQRKRRV